MAAILPELEALDDLVVLEEWSNELWTADTIKVCENVDCTNCTSDADFTTYANEYMEACWADEDSEDHEEDWVPRRKRRSVMVSTPTRPKMTSVAVQASAWSIDESVRQSESQDRLRLFARMCNAEAKITELQHEMVALTNHTNIRFTQVYSGKCYQEKWRSDTVGDVLARAKKINFVPVLPKIETFTTDCDF